MLTVFVLREVQHIHDTNLAQTTAQMPSRASWIKQKGEKTFLPEAGKQ